MSNIGFMMEYTVNNDVNKVTQVKKKKKKTRNI